MRYSFGACELDTSTVELRSVGEVIPLEPQAYHLLLFLLENQDRALSKEEILETVWSGRVVSEATLSNCVKQARKAIGDSGAEQKYIRTVRGFGFRFVAELAVQASATGSPTPTPADASMVILPDAIAPPELPAKPSLVILDFQDLSENDSGRLLAEGLAIDLNAQLARLHGLFVIARDSARRFSLEQATLRDVGAQLGVRYAIYGTTQRLASRVRIGITLANTENQEIIWTDQFDRVLDDIFAVQDDIVSAVISSLLPELERAEMSRARLVPTENLDAWECYHRAMWHNFRFTADDSDQAQALLLRAIELDPEFSRAFAGLSFNQFLHTFLHTDDDWQHHTQLALEHAQNSVALDVRDAMSHWVLGRALFLSREHEQAIHSLDRALLANPNYAQGRYARGFVGVHAGQADRALQDLDMARRLSPFDPLLFAMVSSRAVSLAVQGDADAASRWAVEATLEPNAHFHIHAIAAACLQMAGKKAEAEKAVQRVRSMHPDYSVAVFERAFPHHDPRHGILFHEALRAAGLGLT